MKMVSQLTRQAMNRHRMLRTLSPAPYIPPFAAYPPPEPSVRPLYSPQTAPPLVPAQSPILPQPSAPARPLSAPPQPPRVRSIYQQLMSSHDRMNKRHLSRP